MGSQDPQDPLGYAPGEHLTIPLLQTNLVVQTEQSVCLRLSVLEKITFELNNLGLQRR